MVWIIASRSGMRLGVAHTLPNTFVTHCDFRRRSHTREPYTAHTSKHFRHALRLSRFISVRTEARFSHFQTLSSRIATHAKRAVEALESLLTLPNTFVTHCDRQPRNYLYRIALAADLREPSHFSPLVPASQPTPTLYLVSHQLVPTCERFPVKRSGDTARKAAYDSFSPVAAISYGTTSPRRHNNRKVGFVSCCFTFRFTSEHVLDIQSLHHKRDAAPLA